MEEEEEEEEWGMFLKVINSHFLKLPNLTSWLPQQFNQSHTKLKAKYHFVVRYIEAEIQWTPLAITRVRKIEEKLS